MVKYLKRQWKVGQKRGMLLAHLPEARRLFAELKLHEDKDYRRIVGPNKEKIREYLERHYIEGAMKAFDLTHSLKIALLYLYHGLEGKNIERMSLPGEIKGLEEPVKDMLRNYYEIKALDNMLYTADEVNKYYACAIVHKDQYAARFIDELDKLQLMAGMELNLDRRFLAEKVMAHGHIMKRLGFHAASGEAFNASFEVLAPTVCSAVKKRFYGEDVDRGQAQMAKVVEGLQRMFTDFLAKAGINGHVETRAKSIYSIYRKIVERWQVPLRKGLKGLEAMSDLVALRIILTGKNNNKKSVYRLLDEIERAPGFFRYADPETIGPEKGKKVKVKKDYIKNPPMNPPRPYQSIHMIGDFSQLATAFRNEYGRRLYDERVKLALRNVEIQLRTDAMHQRNEFGRGPAAHGRYKTRGMPTVAEEIATTISEIHTFVRINKKVKIVVMEDVGRMALMRLNPPSYELLHNKPHLASKIMRALAKVYGRQKIEDPQIDDALMDRIKNAEQYDVVVRVRKDPKSGAIAIVDIL